MCAIDLGGYSKTQQEMEDSAEQRRVVLTVLCRLPAIATEQTGANGSCRKQKAAHNTQPKSRHDTLKGSITLVSECYHDLH